MSARLLFVALPSVALGLLAGCDTPVSVANAPPDKICNAQNCPDGCCYDFECIPRAQQRPERCGTQGADCVSCPGGTNAMCEEGRCYLSQCGPCQGCCWAYRCQAGSESGQCGRYGAPCEMCDFGTSCVNQSCQPCGPSNCAGCCSSGGHCEAGNSGVGCGRGGVACKLCGGFTTCQAGTCR